MLLDSDDDGNGTRTRDAPSAGDQPVGPVPSLPEHEHGDPKEQEEVAVEAVEVELDEQVSFAKLFPNSIKLRTSNTLWTISEARFCSPLPSGRTFTPILVLWRHS